jgi:hypothetical protein
VPKLNIELGVQEPLVAGRINDKFLMTLESVQLEAIDRRAEAAGLSRVAYVRKALYHYMNCEEV